VTAGDAKPRDATGYNENTLEMREIWPRFRRGVLVALGAAGRGVIEFYNSSNLTYASSVAYYSLLSIFPFILLVWTVLSRVAVVQAGGEAAVERLLERALPRNFDFLSSQIVAMQNTPIELTIAGTLVTLWASMGVFGAITSAVNHAWGVAKPYTFLKHKLVAFLMLLVAGLVFASAVFTMGAARAAQEIWFRPAYDWFPWLAGMVAFGSRYAFMGSTVLGIGLIYYFLPNTKVRLRDVWFGALLAAFLWHGALLGFSWYLNNFGRFGVNGSISAVVAFLVWVYLSAVILLYGVEVTAAYARLRQQVDLGRL
jgi:membrane protein